MKMELNRFEKLNLFILHRPLLSYFLVFLLMNLSFNTYALCESLNNTVTPSEESFPNKKVIIISLTVLALIGVCVIGYYCQIDTDPITDPINPLISKLSPELLTQKALEPVLKTLSIVNKPVLHPMEAVDPSLIVPLVVAPAVVGILHVLKHVDVDPALVFDSMRDFFLQKFNITFINPPREVIAYEDLHPTIIDSLDKDYVKALTDTNTTVNFRFLTNTHVIDILKRFQVHLIMQDGRTACMIPRTMFVALLNEGFSESDIYGFFRTIHAADGIDLFINPLRQHLENLQSA